MSIDKVESKTVNAASFPCPCGSGTPIINCCVTLRVDTFPPLPKTEFSNPRCYARALNDCSRKTSREHFVSESVLKIIEVPNKGMNISGPNWLAKGRERKISLASITSKVLCERHNAALGPLDEVGKKFFEYIMRVNEKTDILMINGDEVERWMLKLLCGYLASGNISSDYKNKTPPNSWVLSLFAESALPKGSGLYILRGKDIEASYHQIGVWPLESDEKGVFNGLFFLIGGFQFLFFIGSPRKDIPVKIFNSGWQMRFRPECIIIASDFDQKEVHLGLPPRGGFVTIKMSNRS